jgi:hypothetical protein
MTDTVDREYGSAPERKSVLSAGSTGEENARLGKAVSNLTLEALILKGPLRESTEPFATPCRLAMLVRC